MGAIQLIRGTRDILPEEAYYWQQVEAVARQILNRAVYQEIRPPIFEQTALFERGIGEATDVVSKEMYTFRDLGDRSITLRPEGTAGVVRAFIEHNLHTQGVKRLWYGGSMFRYERPQAGRQRQFHQIGVELIGSADPRADVEVIAIATDILQTLGLKSLRLDLNSVGNPEERQRYREALVSYLTPYAQELDQDSQERLHRNPIRILDSKDKRTQEITQNAPTILDHLGSESQAHFEKVQQRLTDLGIDYQINPYLVRGLDYYTHTAFEIQSDDLGAQATVCGGGRYDGLVAQLGGPDTPAVGWAIGMERLILLLQKLQAAPTPSPDFYVVSRGDRAEAQALLLAQKLRQSEMKVELDLSGSAFTKQFKRADRSGAVACLVLGDAEAENHTVQLKWMASQQQRTIPQAELLSMTEELRDQIDLLVGPS
ncbi:MAG: histidine--tRNA ligase [Cyanobacteria bacterium SW_12_48_29]|jgi:histidyl-tRNA synthetase|nr:MAG: histidine--tRNA ligase [Cyanobacteria bacterium QS_1_48_34]PSO81324.1 MAG: histidine--tRNA ligase [Cyanobacteria bacterium QS_4_48_99]PSO91527.1 MAG: histidine--tRNA ligase [Cyanobacteria bacterium QS_3_48_167]PSO93807.1 MAG: histidine--tRNA ligase [Cyanobacteria bacterium QS_6_48_18]PSP04930.1 MAG: histidine--tRNA ligase [Cyanobacteria bacterium SW_12_48_29]PSP10225.1 MAG: histidine--tRNA ligase [Cyanobacteria bacterium SW_10_48_33]PSP13282.1 MAG: histidine--tRNA ligase [Cyanobacteri